MIHLYNGDCMAMLKDIPDGSVDSIVCDPPYGIGFLGKDWDQSVPSLQWAAQCLRVLKPGGHLIAFASTRTVHRLAATVEDAGFDIRDQLGWVYSSGFPKSMNISAAIDKQRHDRDQVLTVTAWIKAQRDRAGVTNKQIDQAFGFAGMAGHWTSTKSQPTVPTLEQIPLLFSVLDVTKDEVPKDIYKLIIDLNGRKNEVGEDWKKREVTGKHKAAAAAQIAWGADASAKEIRGQSKTKDGRKWQGWGTALKPAIEPAVLARKPFLGTVADNVKKHHTGGLNIDKCRRSLFGVAGDFPANLINITKPSQRERHLGCEKNTHPTIKPVALMRWLVRLVTPPGGVTVDPFMGSGAAGVAAVLEGFDYIGAEMDTEYFNISKSRIEHAQAYPEAWEKDGNNERQKADQAGQESLF